MKEEALKLADELEKPVSVPNQPDMIYIDGHRMYGAQMIRRLVEELDKQGEPVVYWDGKHFASKEKSSLADIPLYTTPQTKQEHCCPDCGCHFVGEFPFNYAPQTKPLSDDEMKVFKEIIRISDRKNDLWDKAKTILERHGIK